MGVIEGARAPARRGSIDASGRRSAMPLHWTRLCVLVDAVMLAGGALVERLATELAGTPPLPTVWLLLMPLLTLGLLAARGLYRRRLQLQLADDLRLVVGATAVAAMTVITARILLGGDAAVAGQVAHQWFFSVVYLTAGRIGLSTALSRSRRIGEAAVPTLIVGAGAVGRLAARRLSERPELGLRPVAYLDADPLPARSAADDLPVLDDWNIAEAVAAYGAGQVLVAFSTAPTELQVQIIRDCHDAGVPVAFVPRLYEAVPVDVEVEHVGGLPLVSLRPADPRSLTFRIKYALDRVVVAAAIVVVWPVLVAAAAAVWISVGRPILFRQVRVGRDGRVFEMLKFRTMVDGGSGASFEPDADTGPGGVEGADRRTAVGRFLRRTAIDELPQLFNVLAGEMSLVGPRPERPEFARRFEQTVHRYGDRYRVKAGITGWAQIAGLRGKTSIGDRAEWDNWYIENWSPWLDLKILLRTLPALWRASGTE